MLSVRSCVRDIDRWLDGCPQPSRYLTGRQAAGQLYGMGAVPLADHPDVFVLDILPERQTAGTLVMWGFPHPDEPTGGLTALMIAGGWLEQGPPPGLEGVPLRVCACIDPDAAAAHPWHAEPTLEGFLQHYRRDPGSDYMLHVPTHAPSQALKLLLNGARGGISVAAALHADPCAGQYTFLSRAPDPALYALLEAFAARPGEPPLQIGAGGEPGDAFDPARPWLLSDTFERGSVAGYLSAMDLRAVMVTPEVPIFLPRGLRAEGPAGMSIRELLAFEHVRHSEWQQQLSAVGPAPGRISPMWPSFTDAWWNWCEDPVENDPLGDAPDRPATQADVATMKSRWRLMAAVSCALHGRHYFGSGNGLELANQIAPKLKVTPPGIAARSQARRTLGVTRWILGR